MQVKNLNLSKIAQDMLFIAVSSTRVHDGVRLRLTTEQHVRLKVGKGNGACLEGICRGMKPPIQHAKELIEAADLDVTVLDSDDPRLAGTPLPRTAVRGRA